MHPQTPLDQEIVAWYDSQTEELLATLPGYEDGLTPRQAWYAFFNLCSSPATNTTGESLAAPADGGQGAGSVDLPNEAVVLGSFVDGNDGLTYVWGTCEGGFFATDTLDGPSWGVWPQWHQLTSVLLQRQAAADVQPGVGPLNVDDEIHMALSRVFGFLRDEGATSDGANSAIYRSLDRLGYLKRGA